MPLFGHESGEHRRGLGLHAGEHPAVDVDVTLAMARLSRSLTTLIGTPAFTSRVAEAGACRRSSFFKEEPGPGAVKSLLRQGLIERRRGQDFISADVAFSLASTTDIVVAEPPTPP